MLNSLLASVLLFAAPWLQSPNAHEQQAAGLSAGTLDFALALARSSCAAEEWVSPSTVQDGVFDGHVGAECTLVPGPVIPNGPIHSMLRLEQVFQKVIRNSVAVHRGPVEETYEGLQSVMYEVTVDHRDTDSTATIREDVHLATDLRSRLVYATHATGIQGTGNSKHVIGVDTSIRAVPGQEPETLKLRFELELRAARPALVPTGLFRREAEKSTIRNFKRGMAEVLAEIAAGM